MKLSFIIFSFIALLLFTYFTEPQKSEWRGKNRTGIYIEKNLLKTWPEGGPKEIWTLENIGNGYVSPVFSGEYFYITGEIDSMSVLFCFNLAGKMKWKTVLGKEWTKTRRGSRSAPTIIDDYIYVGTGLGNLYCVTRDNGKVVWSKDLQKDFNGILPLHGHAEAALVDGNSVFWTPGGKEYNVVALDRFSGKLIWYEKGFGERSGYNSPMLIELKAGNIMVTFSAYHLMGLNAKTGKLLWWHEQDNTPIDKRTPGNGDTHSNTVIYEEGSIYYAEGDGNCGVKLKLSDDGNSIKEIWRNKAFDSYMGGIVKIGNWIYCGSSVKPQITSIDAGSGILTDSLKIGSGAVIAADDMLYYYTQKGEMYLLDIQNGKMTVSGSFSIKKGTAEHFAHPVINKGILYQRHGNTLQAFDIRKHDKL